MITPARREIEDNHKRMDEALFNINERPDALRLQSFCNRYGTGAKMRAKMARSIGMSLSAFDDCYYGKRGRRMRPSDWTLLRITWDALLLAQWQEHRPTTEGEDDGSKT